MMKGADPFWKIDIFVTAQLVRCIHLDKAGNHWNGLWPNTVIGGL